MRDLLREFHGDKVVALPTLSATKMQISCNKRMLKPNFKLNVGRYTHHCLIHSSWYDDVVSGAEVPHVGDVSGVGDGKGVGGSGVVDLAHAVLAP